MRQGPDLLQSLIKYFQAQLRSVPILFFPFSSLRFCLQSSTLTFSLNFCGLTSFLQAIITVVYLLNQTFPVWLSCFYSSNIWCSSLLGPGRRLPQWLSKYCFFFFFWFSFFQDGLKAAENLTPFIEKLAASVHTVSSQGLLVVCWLTAFCQSVDVKNLSHPISVYSVVI